MQILRASQLQKYYGAMLILDEVSLSLSRGDRAALVGENGVGKSTLARLILQQEAAERGEVWLRPGAQVAYLPQEVRVHAQLTVNSYIEARIGDLRNMRDRLRELERQMGAGGDLEALLDEYGRLQERFEARGGYTLDSRLAQIFAGLALEHIEPGRSMMSLSGGEQTRVGLAALLLQAPDLLILDEPTNHLDFAGLTWLEDYLLDYPHALLMITHDRHLINRLATCILDLSAVTRRLTAYYGNYADYLAQRQAQYESQVAAYHAQLNQMKALRTRIKKETHGHRRPKRPDDGDKWIKFTAQQQVARTVGKAVRSAKTQLQQLEANPLENPRHVWHIEFDFDPLPLASQEPLRLDSLALRFGARELFAEAKAVLRKGERVALVAPNGGGKTSLLRLITGELMPSSGAVTVSPGAALGYLDQTGVSFDENQNILDLLREIGSDTPDTLLTLLHRSGLFRDAHLARKSVAELSLGQRRKLGLACLIHSRANLLLLDEPTNHLDLLSLEALERSLLAFPGAILAATH
ncbi:MAG: ABC-F family ATP-binding cassette domain-containing protein, partial [Chloroflexi bacterium]|nr:ABC-F family ATP-binding cassette domain-containing protein [Chloroflexota bacterium]